MLLLRLELLQTTRACCVLSAQHPCSLDPVWSICVKAYASAAVPETSYQAPTGLHQVGAESGHNTCNDTGHQQRGKAFGGSGHAHGWDSNPITSLLTDMRHPASWYPAARALQRTIVCHLGPTNSGKTHKALQAMKAAKSGLYCGPLRLLACEVADRLNASGLPCHLVTGQEVRQVEGAKHTSCTVEMAAVGSEPGDVYEVAVLDEIQMLGDKGRGWAWTRALLGLRAKTIHVCGDPAALPLLQQLADDCGDDLQVNVYQRLTPLVVSNEALGSLSELRPGDALVAFSRRAVHGLQREVVRRAPWATPSMVYGALPPDARRHQAVTFNNRAAQCDVLVASDAIGMGLNLAINRIIFTSLAKWDGKQVRQLSASEVRQIAGRAGRFGMTSTNQDMQPPTDAPTADLSEFVSHHEDHQYSSPDKQARHRHQRHRAEHHAERRYERRHKQAEALECVDTETVQEALQETAGHDAAGVVTCLQATDLQTLHDAMREPPVSIQRASLLPRIEDLALYYTAVTGKRNGVPTDDADDDSSGQARPTRHTSLLQVLLQYASEARLAPHYCMADMAPMLALAGLLSGPAAAGLSIDELLIFCMAPADTSNTTVASALLRFVALYVEDGDVPLAATHVTPGHSRHSILGLDKRQHPCTDEHLRRLEDAHAVLDVYVWLSFRFPLVFREREEAIALRSHLASLITRGLEHMSVYHHTRSFEDKFGHDRTNAKPKGSVRHRKNDRLLSGRHPKDHGSHIPRHGH